MLMKKLLYVTFSGGERDASGRVEGLFKTVFNISYKMNIYCGDIYT